MDDKHSQPQSPTVFQSVARGLMEKTGTDRLLDKLLSRPEVAKTYEQIQQQDILERSVTARFKDLTEADLEASFLNERLAGPLALYKGVSIGRSIFEELKKSQSNAGGRSVESVVPSFLSAYLIQKFEPEIRRLAKSNAEEARRNLEQFTHENAATLKGLGLI